MSAYATHRRRYITVIVVAFMIAFGALGYAVAESAGLGDDNPQTTLICTSSATYAPDVGEQKTKLICTEQ